MKLLKRIEDIFMAVSFAEEGEANTALLILEEHRKTGRQGKEKELPARETIVQRLKHDI
ncbi:MAG: hypothetical protein ACM34I_00140 [bacterium]